MAIIKDVTVKINNGTATLDAPVQFYEKDHDVELRFRLMDYKYKYDKDPQNILNSVDEDVLEAYTTIVNPRGYELEQINGVVKNDVVIFRLDPTYTDELDELGTYKLQIHIKCTHSEFTIPPITFEVLQRLKGIKVVTDGEDEVDNSEILDNSSKFVSDETGKLIIEWKKGDMISSAKLNAMVDVINDAVDEEKIRQENETEREKKANNKIQELENTRVEYVNKFDDELDSFADQVDTTMSDYETRFNALTVSQQQDAEIIDARDGEQTLRARLDRDIQKPSIIYEDVEGSYINVDTTCGYAQNIEILGNTIQNQNDLADIRSVGDKVEGQELYEIPVVSCGKIQLEEGTVATSYEPYQGDKLTILSPVQLEKVGDVADRIICKDGVWGVEKNVKTIYTKDFANYINAFEDKEATFKWGKQVDTKMLNVMSNFMPKGSLSTEQSQSQIMIYDHTSYREFRIAFKKADFPNFDVRANVVKYLSDENKYIKVVQDSQFIPLPYDQQIKLRTFANKTNIHFECEIEPTLKASVPKSLGASVSSHSEQIDNLGKELDKVKKLEESTALTVTTESIEGSYVSVDSKDGYLKDIEIIGNTIQNQNDLADIRSVGDKLENQELYEIPVLSCGKNLFDEVYVNQTINGQTGILSGLVMNRFTPANFIRCKANTPYTIKITGDGVQIREVYYYNLDGSYIGVAYGSSYKTLYTFTPTKDILVKWQCKRIDDTDIPVSSLPGVVTTQLEEGTVATSYEPYQEDKLTILSPTPLEKVGDIADRIICKDGVWGVEKNIKTEVVDGTKGTFKTLYKNDVNTDFYMWASITDILPSSSILTNLLTNKQVWNEDHEGIYVHNEIHTDNIRFRFLKTRGIPFTVNGITDFFKTNPMLIKYPTTQPTFIPLPHDQQIALRTFANKTNIHFLTEIEPTLKASVPKSISATVSTHTEQIDNLGKEIDKIKKLEESTVSTVTTESDFTTVENTSNGYFEDVKLKGRTLVNLNDIPHNWILNTSSTIVYLRGDSGGNLQKIQPNTIYTVILYGLNDKFQNRFTITNVTNETIRLSNGVGLITSKDTISDAEIKNPHLYGKDLKTQDVENVKLVILEGDHTQNPPEFFEGIKSVGQDVDEISVEARSKNLLEIEHEGKYRDYDSGALQLNIDFNSYIAKVMPNTRYRISASGDTKARISKLCFFDSDFNYIKGIPIDVFNFVTPSNCAYLTVAVHKDLKNVQIEKGDNVTYYVPPKSNSKVLLYYNDETQAWEKPVLRQWDSIEKHSDGKYYYHKRSGEVVLNGSEDWACEPPMANTIYGICTVISVKNYSEIRCDKFKGYNYSIYTDDIEGIYTAENRVKLKISNSKLSTQDAAGFKAWLQANNVTVVYQLAEEKVYECTSIDLITYENETNYIVTAGAIAPVSTLKVMCNINNVVRELQQKVSNLENYIQHVMIDALNNALNE